MKSKRRQELDTSNEGEIQFSNREYKNSAGEISCDAGRWGKQRGAGVVVEGGKTGSQWHTAEIVLHEAVHIDDRDGVAEIRAGHDYNEQSNHWGINRRHERRGLWFLYFRHRNGVAEQVLELLIWKSSIPKVWGVRILPALLYSALGVDGDFLFVFYFTL